METLIKDIAEGLQHSPLAWILAVALAVIGYLYRGREADQKRLVDMMTEKETQHRETLMKVLPIAEKLGDSVEALERVTTSLLRGDK